MNKFPELDSSQFNETRNALHAYAKVLGVWTAGSRPKRKHWWHASLRPSLRGISTGVIYAAEDFELELDLSLGQLTARMAKTESMHIELTGQSPHEIALAVQDYLFTTGIADQFVPDVHSFDKGEFENYSPTQARLLNDALHAVSACLNSFRAGIREETSPIQLWPHHFDLAMLWLPGDKIPGQDIADEENSDVQMNFGFTFGDESIPEPYFYITAYPAPPEFSEIELPADTNWNTTGFTGAILLYKTLQEMEDPQGYLLNLCNTLLAGGRKTLSNVST